MKKVILYFCLFLFFVALISAGQVFANTVEVESTYLDMGSIEPGKAGWDFTNMRDAKIGVTCNITDTSKHWRLTLKVSTFSNNQFDLKNIKFKIYYIGYALHDYPYWRDIREADLLPYIPPGFSNEEFVSNNASTVLSSTAMTVLDSSLFTLPPGVGASWILKIVLGVTVQIPEAGYNLAGDYLSTLEFELID